MTVSTNLRKDNACSILQLDQQFTDQCYPTIGCEVELAILDRHTRQPLNLFRAIKDRLPTEIRERTQAEYLGSQLEYASAPHACVGDLAAELRAFENAAADQARRQGAELSWQANFPFWEFDTSMLGECERGPGLAKRLGQQTEQLATNSVHFHVAVPRSKAIQVMDALQGYLPLFIALSANSPLHQGRPTGRMSHRAAVWSNNFSVCGLAQPYGDWNSFQRRMAKLIDSGRISSPKDIYYFVRPTRYGTIELRCCDLPCSLDHAAALAALYQTLVAGLIEGLVALRPERDILRAEMHDAITRGLRAELCDHTGRRGSPLE